MLTFEKVMEVFRAYLTEDTRYEIVMTSHGYTILGLIAEQVASCNICHIHKFNGVGRIGQQLPITGRRNYLVRIGLCLRGWSDADI